MTFDPRPLVEDLRDALTAVSPALDSEQIDDVRTYIDVGEWGLALDTLSELVSEQEIPISRATYETMERAAATMGVEPRAWRFVAPLVRDNESGL